MRDVFCGQKSPTAGIDLTFERDGTRYIVAIKSGQSWGNSSQHARLRDDLKRAVRVLRQNHEIRGIEPVLGICYGNARRTHTGEYLKVCGQDFWELISGDDLLYTEIIEPLGFEAERHNERFREEFAATLVRCTTEFGVDFCVDGRIDWQKLVAYNSGR